MRARTLVAGRDLTSTPRNQAIRLAAFEFLRKLCHLHGDVVPRDVLLRGFDFDGQRVPLLSPQGIFQPVALTDAPISITTVPPIPGKERPYDDDIGDDGLLQYRYRGTDPHHRDNEGLRRAMAEGIPLIYLFGVVPGQYEPVWPIYIVGDDPSTLTFLVRADEERSIQWLPAGADRVAEARREYVTVEVQRRLHQQGFRMRVLRAYTNRCTVCRLKRVELLDAAHILEDKHPLGLPAISNGLALCKLHHAAFDRCIIGIRPNYRIEVRLDILEEEDGPMLVHGIQEFQGQVITIPRRSVDQPNVEYLEERYARFCAAG